MAFELPAVIRQHPYATGGTVLAGALVLYLYWNSGGSSGAATYSDPNTGAELAYAQTQAQIAGSAAGQTSAQDYQLTAQQQQIAGQEYSTDASLKVALAQLDLQGSQTQASLQVALDQSKNASDAQLAAINAGLTESTNALTVQQNLATIAANEQTAINANTTAAQIQLGSQQESIAMAGIAAQEHIAGINATVQSLISNNQTGVAINQSNNQANVGIAQTNAAVAIAKTNASASTTNSIIGLAAGVIGAFL